MSASLSGFVSKVFLGMVSIITLCTFLACSSGNDNPTPIDPSIVINGRAMKGPVLSGSVTVYSLNTAGTRGSILASATTDADGFFVFNQVFSGMIEFVVTGGSYIDESTGTTVDMTGYELTLIHDEGLDNGDEITISPLTTAAAIETRARLSLGETAEEAIDASNEDIAAWFGLTGIDISSTTPHDLTDSSETALAGEAATLYGAAIATLSQQISRNGLEPTKVFDLLANIGEDLADDLLDGMMGNAPLSAALPFSPATFFSQLDQVADEFLDSDANDSGLSADDVELENNGASDTTAPVLQTAFSEFAITTITWTGAAALDEDGTGYCIALLNGSTAPTASQIIMGSHANIAGTGGTVEMMADSLSACTVTGLTFGTTYDFYFVAQDEHGNVQSDAVAAGSKVSASTSSDGTPPTTTVALAQVSVDGTTWTGSATISEDGVGFCAAVSSGSDAPTPQDIMTSDEDVVRGIAGEVIMVANNTANCTVTGLTETRTYDFYFTARDAMGNLQTTVSGPVTTTTLDSMPPELVADLSRIDVTHTTWTGIATISEDGMGYIVALSAVASFPTPEEVVNDNSIDGHGTGCSMEMVKNVANSCRVRDLQEATVYNFYFIAEDTSANLMEYVVGPITDSTLDITPPSVDVAWAEQGNAIGIRWSGTVSIDEVGTGYCVAVLRGNTKPTTTQVKAGTGGAIVGIGGNMSMSNPNSSYNCTVSGLTEQTDYDFYFAAEDVSGNIMSKPAGPVQATTADVTPPSVDVAWAQFDNTLGTSWIGSASVDEVCDGYCVAVPNGSAAPSSEQVRDRSGGAIVGTGGVISMDDPATTYQCTVSGLVNATIYDFYFVGEDVTGNLFLVPAGPVTATTP